MADKNSYTKGKVTISADSQDVIQSIVRIMDQWEVFKFDRDSEGRLLVFKGAYLDNKIDRPYIDIENVIGKRVYAIEIDFHDRGDGDYFYNEIRYHGELLEQGTRHLVPRSSERMKERAFSITYEYVDLDFTKDIFKDCRVHLNHHAGDLISRSDCYADFEDSYELTRENLVSALGYDGVIVNEIMNMYERSKGREL